MAKQYTENDLGILVAGDWGLVMSEGAEVVPSVGVRASQREKPGPWNHPRDEALPFPFTLAQFRDFCNWHTYFQWEVIEAKYLNDDGSLDEDALAELEQRGEDAAELVRRYLTGDSDAAAHERKPGGATDHSESTQEGAAAPDEVQANALVRAIAMAVDQHLRNPTDALAAPPIAQQDAPSLPVNNKRWTDEKKAELRTYRERYGTKRAAEHFGITEQRVRQLLPGAKKWVTPFQGLVRSAR